MPFIASSVQKAVAGNIVGLANSGTVNNCWINSGVQLFVRCTPARLKQVIHTVDTKMLQVRNAFKDKGCSEELMVSAHTRACLPDMSPC